MKQLQQRKRAFLETLVENGNVSKSAQIVGIHRVTVYKWRDVDPDFKKEWDEAVEQAVDAMILEARRRAVEGVAKPVFYQGEICGHIQEYSDTLLMFLIKAHRPEYATERRQISGVNNGPIRTETTIGIPDYDPNDPESIRRAHEAVFGTPEALMVIKDGTET